MHHEGTLRRRITVMSSLNEISTTLFPNLSSDISFNDDVTSILLLGVSLMRCGCDWGDKVFLVINKKRLTYKRVMS
jgi:hypothetical protein